MNIRLATEQDVTEISKLWLDMVEEIAPDAEPNVEWFIDSVLLNIKNSNYYMMLAENKGEIIGFLETLFYPDAFSGRNCAMIRNFYVKPEYDNKGIAELLQRQMYQVSGFYDIRAKQIVTPESMIDFWLEKNFKITSAIMEA